MNTITSEFMNLDLKDLSKGLIVSAGGSVVAFIETSLNSGSFILDWKAIGGVALASGLSYLGKNFFTPAQSITKV